MDIKRDIDALLSSGLTFSIEIMPGSVWIWVGQYLKTTTPTATVGSIEQAITWLQRYPTDEPCGSCISDGSGTFRRLKSVGERDRYALRRKRSLRPGGWLVLRAFFCCCYFLS